MVGVWERVDMSFFDYMEKYIDNPNFKFIKGTAKNGMVGVLVHKDSLKEIKHEHVPLRSLF